MTLASSLTLRGYKPKKVTLRMDTSDWLITHKKTSFLSVKIYSILHFCSPADQHFMHCSHTQTVLLHLKPVAHTRCCSDRRNQVMADGLGLHSVYAENNQRGCFNRQIYGTDQYWAKSYCRLLTVSHHQLLFNFLCCYYYSDFQGSTNVYFQ